MSAGEWVGSAEAQRITGLDGAALLRLMRQGAVAARPVPGRWRERWRYRLSDLLAVARIEDGDWRNDAACLGTDPEMFFPDSRGGAYVAHDAAKQVCAGCPVAADCLSWAMTRELRFDGGIQGIWGGTTQEERRAMLAGAR